MPVTIPDKDPIVAIAVFPLLHEPPDVPSVKPDVDPWHNVVTPVMLPGVGLTVTFLVMLPEHPEPSVTNKVTGKVPEAVNVCVGALAVLVTPLPNDHSQETLEE